MTDQTNTTEVQQDAAQTELTPPEINLRDIGSVVQIIDAVAKRGAFDAKEFQTVGAVRDRFASFLEYHLPKKEEEDAGSEVDAPQEEA